MNSKQVLESLIKELEQRKCTFLELGGEAAEIRADECHEHLMLIDKLRQAEEITTYKVLHLPLKAKRYDMQESGEKPEEYMEITPYWIKRLVDTHSLGRKMLCKVPEVAASLIRSGCVHIKDYTHVCLRYGYTQRCFINRIDSITIGRGNPEWGAPTDRDVFIIRHHKE